MGVPLPLLFGDLESVQVSQFLLLIHLDFRFVATFLRPEDFLNEVRGDFDPSRAAFRIIIEQSRVKYRYSIQFSSAS